MSNEKKLNQKKVPLTIKGLSDRVGLIETSISKLNDVNDLILTKVSNLQSEMYPPIKAMTAMDQSAPPREMVTLCNKLEEAISGIEKGMENLFDKVSPVMRETNFSIQRISGPNKAQSSLGSLLEEFTERLRCIALKQNAITDSVML